MMQKNGLRASRSPRLIIFDTLAGVRPERSNKDTLYDGDYRALTELQASAGQGGISVIVLHHTRKMESDDPIDSVSGTLGLTGCVDTVAAAPDSLRGRRRLGPINRPDCHCHP